MHERQRNHGTSAATPTPLPTLSGRADKIHVRLDRRPWVGAQKKEASLVVDASRPNIVGQNPPQGRVATGNLQAVRFPSPRRKDQAYASGGMPSFCRGRGSVNRAAIDAIPSMMVRFAHRSRLSENICSAAPSRS